MKDGRRFGGPPKPYQPPDDAGGQDQRHRSRLAQRQDAARLGAGLQRPGRRQRAADRDRRRGDDRLAGLRAPRADGRRRPSASSQRPASPRRPRWCSPTPATGTRSRWSSIVDRGIAVLIPPDAGKRKGARPGWDGGLYAFMRRVLATDHGGELYRQRQGDDRAGLRATPSSTAGIDRFQRRGRSAVPLGMATDHRHPQPAQAPPPPDRRRRGLKRAPGATNARRSPTRPPRAQRKTAALSLYATATMQLGHCNGHLAQPRLAPPFRAASERRRVSASARPLRTSGAGVSSRAGRRSSLARSVGRCAVAVCSDAAAKDARRGPVMASFAHRASVMSRRARGCRGAWRGWR